MEVSRARKLAQVDELGGKVFKTVLDLPQQARARWDVISFLVSERITNVRKRCMEAAW